MIPLSRTLWIEKYAPRKVSEVVENRRGAERVAEFISSWKPDQKIRALFLWGPAGVGKTASVYAATNELGYDLIEVNASDKRSLEALQRTVGAASSFSSIVKGEKRVILVDEVDGISGSEDKGGINALLEILKKTVYPIILIANDAWDPKLAHLRNICELVRFNRIRSNIIANVLAKICEREGIEADPPALKKIAENARGDLRAAINDLQAVAEGRKRVTIEDLNILSLRDQEKNVFDTLRAIFYGKTARGMVMAVSSSDVDYELLMQWICENAWQHMQNPKELANAYDALSRADVFLGRIRNRQHWGLLSYVFTLMSAGVSLSRESNSGGAAKYQFPSWVKEMSTAKARRKTLENIAGKIGKKCHVSSNEALRSYIPYLKVIIEANPEEGAKLARWFDLGPEMIEEIVPKKITEKVKKAMED